MGGEEKRSPGRPKGTFYPKSALIKAGVWRTLKPGQQRLLMCLDDHTNRDSGLCCPGDNLIAFETGLSRSSIFRARKELQGRVFELELAKYNRQGNPVYHYMWINIQMNKQSTSRGTTLHPATNHAPFCNQPRSTMEHKPTITNSKNKNSPREITEEKGEEGEGIQCIPGDADDLELGHDGDDPEKAALVNSLEETETRIKTLEAEIKQEVKHRWWSG